MIDRHFKTAIILLSAGNSSRLGSLKQELLVDGVPLLTHSIREAIKSQADLVVVVLGYEEERIRRLLPEDPKVTCVSNPDWERGMGASIKAGVSYLLKNRPDIEALIISVCDQPFLLSSHYDTMIDDFLPGKVIVSKYGNEHSGVPVLFDSHYFDLLISIDDSRGAKSLVQKIKDPTLIQFPGGEIDLDTRKDYEYYMRK